jgi:hypothetical protein
VGGWVGRKLGREWKERRGAAVVCNDRELIKIKGRRSKGLGEPGGSRARGPRHEGPTTTRERYEQRVTINCNWESQSDWKNAKNSPVNTCVPPCACKRSADQSIPGMTRAAAGGLSCPVPRQGKNGMT